jgi:hypothetical protein
MSPRHVGIDVHKLSSQGCILTSGGELLERRVRRRIRARLAVRDTLVRTRAKRLPLAGDLARREG